MGVSDPDPEMVMNNGNTQQDAEDQKQLQTYIKKKTEVDLSIEVVLLLVGGVFFLLFGLLLFPISSGSLPYSEGSMYGLFLVLVSMQVITMGKTPFGDLLRSWVVVIIGLGMAILGTLAIFYPEDLSMLARVLAGAIVLVTGSLGTFQLLTAEDRARAWMKVPGILRQLTFACGVVYVTEVLLGLITLVPGVVLNSLTAVLSTAFGISLFYLAWCIRQVTARYRPGLTTAPGGA